MICIIKIQSMKLIEKIFEKLLFASRWIQAPIYFGLILGSIVYTYKFIIELVHLCMHANELTEENVMLSILTLIDISMVVNLIVIVVIGGYSTFVSKLDFGQHEDKPEWLQQINAGTLKVKLAISLVGVSSIQLLRSFIDIKDVERDHVLLQILIHVVFLLSSIILAYTDKIMHGSTEQKH